ncbi:hypothetical protein OG195_38200 [Streptomyces sp. NBC_01362]|uniref:hypothetical protein n=1 Tax=Streptomyces sp. NBC_01362 TaxID=2903839 RepID=UPI002E329FF4|nr:hypothetical protein [Streptomyces sp. NBC_01362]
MPGSAPEILAGGFEEAIGLAVDGEAGAAYVCDLGGHIRTVPLPGGTAADGEQRDIATISHPLTGIAGLTSLSAAAPESVRSEAKTADGQPMWSLSPHTTLPTGLDA